MDRPKTYRISATASTAGSLKTADVKILTGRRLALGDSRDATAGEIEVASDEVVRLEFDNGFILWTRADDLIRERGRQSTKRGGDAAWHIDTRPLRSLKAPPEASRGLLGLGIKLLEFFGVDIAGTSARILAEKLEDRHLKGSAPDLYRCSLEGTFALEPIPVDDAPVADQGPLLVFIHGTGSSGAGSFGELWREDHAAGAAARRALKEQYSDRVFCYEHRTLTASPIENALALAKTLPDDAEVHLVTHSRGGLVGELLCLGQRDRGTDPLDRELLDDLFKADRTITEQLGLPPLSPEAVSNRDAAYSEDRRLLPELLDVLDSKRLQVRRFVRVACPARGTTLASGRLDRWLSVVDFLSGATLLGDALDFLLAVVKERTDPRTLPGLEAMMPGSALTRLLHHPDLEVSADLSVVAGDIEGDSLWGQLKLLATDWFYGADHDLVVNTGSMFGGLRRPVGGARFQRDDGPRVNHFRYFENDKSVKWLVAGLKRPDGGDAGFRPIQSAPHEAPRWREAVRRSRAAERPRPLAVLIPGAMGSQLHVDGEKVWLHYWRLNRGGLGRLHIQAPGVESTDVIDQFYGPLLEFLAHTHQVEVFPYDWRLSVREAARDLTAKLENWLRDVERTNQTVHLVAHSMGGLVARAMIGDQGCGAAVWRRIAALPNSRLLMLGTPNHGSYEAMRWLTGNNPTQRKLGLLDFTRSTEEIVDIVREYPGLVELLPFPTDDVDFADDGLWRTLKNDLNARWHPPGADVLRSVRRTWTLLANSIPDPERMVYVAGCQPLTVSDYEVTTYDEPWLRGRKRLGFLGTRDGDGTVTWQSGRLANVRSWFAEDTGHDELCTQQRAFPGYFDLLMTGRTTHLADSPPSIGRGADQDAVADRIEAVPFTDDMPDESAVRGFGFGPGQYTGLTDGRSPVPVLNASIRHGDLAYARHPVVVGHYYGDTIVSAEAALDQRLGNALTKRLRLGLYPGRLNTHAVFFNEDPQLKPAGAVVVGLGQVGELAPGLLESGFRDALLDYALQVARQPDRSPGAADAVRSAAVSCLLVGTGAGGIPLRSSLEAMLRGAVAANQKLVEADLHTRVLIDEIEFIELYADIAVAAAQAMQTLIRDGALANAVTWEDPVVEEGDGRARRVQFEEAPAWWHRLEIFQDDDRDALRFVTTTERARAEESLVAGQVELADRFVEQASRTSSANTETAKTLFEMLLPNRLKELAPRQNNVVLLVDETSARFPWELLEDRWSQSGRPPAVANGMVRQLKTLDFRPRPAHAFEETAFVIGNPDLEGWRAFPDLPGAREEAASISTLLENGGFRVLDRIDEKADEILNGLHKDAWRILHLAGHGEHEYALPVAPPGNTGQPNHQPSAPAKTLSGMVIGKEMFLTPGDVEQMRWVPELVFINCCHLGKTQSASQRRQYNRLAANLATQYIRMGVRAVIAAGWAVDDAAAKDFAVSFYTHLLGGQAFGEAVRAAREAIWTRYPNRNTWGAYQCYGDPSYQLRPDRSVKQAAAARPYYAPDQLIADLENETERVRMQSRDPGESPRSREDMQALVAALVERIPDSRRALWLQRADVAAAIGFAFGETGAFAEAVEWLDKAISSGAGDCPIRAVEQSANLRARATAEQWNRLREAETGVELETSRYQLVKEIERAITELDLINQRAPTTERLNLLGSACKRLAWIQTADAPRLEALVNMANYYGRAFELSGNSDAYAFTNWAIARILVSRHDPASGGLSLDSIADECDRLTDQAKQQDAVDPSFWNSVTAADCELVRLLLLSRTSQERVASATASYRAAAQRGASPRELASVREHLDFIIEMSASERRSLRNALSEIRRAV